VISRQLIVFHRHRGSRTLKAEHVLPRFDGEPVGFLAREATSAGKQSR
jgi:hypothetical protein